MDFGDAVGTGNRLRGRGADGHRRGGVRFPAAWRGACPRLHPDGDVARRRPARAQSSAARRETTRGGAVSAYSNQ